MAGEKGKVTFPRLTALILGLSLIAYGFPQMSERFVYDRGAILGGEVWRLATAPLVHFSAGHLFWDALVFAAAGWAIETAGYRGFPLVCGFAAVVPGLFFLLFSPNLSRYGGLSGLATGAVAYLCLCKILETRKNRFLWAAILAVVGVKIAAEALLGVSLFARPAAIPFRVLPADHLFGLLGAVIAVLRMWRPQEASRSTRKGATDRCCP